MYIKQYNLIYVIYKYEYVNRNIKDLIYKKSRIKDYASESAVRSKIDELNKDKDFDGFYYYEVEMIDPYW